MMRHGSGKSASNTGAEDSTRAADGFWANPATDTGGAGESANTKNDAKDGAGTRLSVSARAAQPPRRGSETRERGGWISGGAPPQERGAKRPDLVYSSGQKKVRADFSVKIAQFFPAAVARDVICLPRIVYERGQRFEPSCPAFLHFRHLGRQRGAFMDQLFPPRQVILAGDPAVEVQIHQAGLPGVQVGKPLLAALDLLAAGGLLGLVRLGDLGQHQIRPFGIDGNRFKPRAQPGLNFLRADISFRGKARPCACSGSNGDPSAAPP